VIADIVGVGVKKGFGARVKLIMGWGRRKKERKEAL
jgi:hypothetical protein